MSDRDDELPSLDHLRWQCRRGMLELDYVLRRYLDEHYDAAPLAEQREFVELLSVQDQDLLAWLINGQAPPDPRWGNIVRQVRGLD
jgi:antitoxin CptB